MMIDRMEGRPLELEAIYGITLLHGATKGVEMPRVGKLHALLDLGEITLETSGGSYGKSRALDGQAAHLSCCFSIPIDHHPQGLCGFGFFVSSFHQNRDEKSPNPYWLGD